MEEERNSYKPNNITLKDRRVLNITGVSEIISFDEGCVMLDINDSQLNVEGSMLKITSFSNEAGDVTVCGNIDSIMYVGKTAASYRKGIIKRIFSYDE